MLFSPSELLYYNSHRLGSAPLQALSLDIDTLFLKLCLLYLGPLARYASLLGILLVTEKMLLLDYAMLQFLYSAVPKISKSLFPTTCGHLKKLSPASSMYKFYNALFELGP